MPCGGQLKDGLLSLVDAHIPISSTFPKYAWQPPLCLDCQRIGCCDVPSNLYQAESQLGHDSLGVDCAWSLSYIAVWAVSCRPTQGMAGDVIVLTKPLGTQIAVNAHQWIHQVMLVLSVCVCLCVS